MFEPLTCEQFAKLMQLTVDKYKLDPETTYLELTWWDKVFKPCISMSTDDSRFVVVFSNDDCQKWSDDMPCGFYIFNDAVHIDNVVHRPMRISNFLNNEWMQGFANVKFMMTGSPQNFEIQINPFKTRVYKNRDNETIVCLYAEDRDSGEWVPFDNITANNIELITQ